MLHDANEYELRAAECRRLAYATKDPVLQQEILSLSRIYLDYAAHLRGRDEGVDSCEDAGWRKAVNA